MSDRGDSGELLSDVLGELVEKSRLGDAEVHTRINTFLGEGRRLEAPSKTFSRWRSGRVKSIARLDVVLALAAAVRCSSVSEVDRLLTAAGHKARFEGLEQAEGGSEVVLSPNGGNSGGYRDLLVAIRGNFTPVADRKGDRSAQVAPAAVEGDKVEGDKVEGDKVEGDKAVQIGDNHYADKYGLAAIVVIVLIFAVVVFLIARQPNGEGAVAAPSVSTVPGISAGPDSPAANITTTGLRAPESEAEGDNTVSSSALSEPVDDDVHTQSIRSLTVEAELGLLISSDEDGTVAVRDTDGYALLGTLDIGSVVRSADVSNSGQYMAVGSQESTFIYSTADWSPVAELRCAWCLVRWIDNDESLLTISQTALHRWEAGTYRELGFQRLPDSTIQDVAMKVNQLEFVLMIRNTGTQAGPVARLERWRIVKGIPELVGGLGELEGNPWKIVLSPDETKLASIGIGGGQPMQTWDAVNGGSIVFVDNPGRGSNSVAWLAEDLIVTGHSARIDRWDLSETVDSPIDGFDHGEDGEVTGMGWDRLQRVLYTTHDDGEICAWPANDDWIETSCTRVD